MVTKIQHSRANPWRRHLGHTVHNCEPLAPDAFSRVGQVPHTRPWNTPSTSMGHCPATCCSSFSIWIQDHLPRGPSRSPTPVHPSSLFSSVGVRSSLNVCPPKAILWILQMPQDPVWNKPIGSISEGRACKDQAQCSVERHPVQRLPQSASGISLKP